MERLSVMITGADGYLGRLLACRYRAEGRPVLLWLRARDEAEALAKRAALMPELAALPVSWGDLRDAEPFARVAPHTIGAIVHGAAVTRFNVDRATAQRVNAEGTAKLIAFAERCKHLEAFALLSTLYCSGLAAGALEERPLDSAREFANHYERSKWEGEQALLHSSLPWRICRIGTVIADDESGAVTQHNAVHRSLKLLFYGLLSLLPGASETPLYLVTGRFAADSVHALMGRGAAGAIYHVAHTRNESITLGRLVDVVFEVFGQSEDFRARRILRPLFADRASFELLLRSLEGLAGELGGDALATFAPQLYVSKDVRNDNLTGALATYAAPDPQALVRATAQQLVRTRWGRNHA